MQLIKKNWHWFFICAFLFSSVVSIWAVYESRNLVARLYDLRLVEEGLLREKTQLSLEESVLLRGSRLQQYANTRLNLRKAAKVRSISEQ